jgi:hypothetical protein
MIVVRQSRTAHAKIEALLRDIRKQGGVQRTYHVKANWFFLDPKQFAQLQKSLDAMRASLGDVAARKDFEALSETAKAFQGEISCLESQTVSLVSGRGRTVMSGVVPVLANGAAAYEPIVFQVQSGAMLQIKASRTANENVVLLDVHSVVSKPDAAGNPVIAPAILPAPAERTQEPTRVSIDRVNLVVQQFATTVEVPAGRPVIVGGLTFDPELSKDVAKEDHRLYLVVEVQPVTHNAGQE